MRDGMHDAGDIDGLDHLALARPRVFAGARRASLRQRCFFRRFVAAAAIRMRLCVRRAVHVHLSFPSPTRSESDENHLFYHTAALPGRV
jgi:hypothetical protein